MDPNCNKVTASTSSTTDTQVKSSQSTNVDLKSNLDPSGPGEVSTDTLQESVLPIGAEIHAPTDKKEKDGTPYVDVEEVQMEASCEEIPCPVTDWMHQHSVRYHVPKFPHSPYTSPNPNPNPDPVS